MSDTHDPGSPDPQAAGAVPAEPAGGSPDDGTRYIVVLGFESRIAAQEALTATSRLATEGRLELVDAVFITRDAGGRVRVTETTDPQPGQSALFGGLWGLLLGSLLMVPVVGLAVGAATSALVAKVVDRGVPDDFVKALRESVQPGGTYLALMISRADVAAVSAELRRFSGLASYVTSNLDAAVVADLQQALSRPDVRLVTDDT